MSVLLLRLRCGGDGGGPRQAAGVLRDPVPLVSHGSLARLCASRRQQRGCRQSGPSGDDAPQRRAGSGTAGRACGDHSAGYPKHRLREVRSVTIMQEIGMQHLLLLLSKNVILLFFFFLFKVSEQFHKHQDLGEFGVFSLKIFKIVHKLWVLVKSFPFDLSKKKATYIYRPCWKREDAIFEEILAHASLATLQNLKAPWDCKNKCQNPLKYDFFVPIFVGFWKCKRSQLGSYYDDNNNNKKKNRVLAGPHPHSGPNYTRIVISYNFPIGFYP